MKESADLKRFLAFVAKREKWNPRFEFMARCSQSLQAPAFSYTLPQGVVMADTEWLVFLTLSENTPGAKLMLSEFVETLASEYKNISKLHDWVDNPLSLVRDVAKYLSHVPKDDDKFAQALMNANSTFICMSDILDVEFKKGIVALRPHHIQLKLRDGGFIIYQDPVTENAFTSLIGQFSGKWHPEFLEMITDFARQNRFRK